MTRRTTKSFDELNDNELNILKQKIDKFREENKNAMSFEDFENSCLAHGYRYADFYRAYIMWQKKDIKKEKNIDITDVLGQFSDVLMCNNKPPMFEDINSRVLKRAINGRENSYNKKYLQDKR